MRDGAISSPTLRCPRPNVREYASHEFVMLGAAAWVPPGCRQERRQTIHGQFCCEQPWLIVTPGIWRPVIRPFMPVTYHACRSQGMLCIQLPATLTT